MQESSNPRSPSADRPVSLDDSERRVLLSKVNWRLIPLLFFCYVIAYIDRINVGFAKLHLREVLGVDETVFGSVYGLGAGLFFIGYFIFELPSNLVLQRVGARIWIARIMIVWGVVSMSMMFMRGTTMFYVMRFLLGAAEAGFFPGVILYLTYWYPARERARTIALFATGGVMAGVIGSPISGAILGLDGRAGLAGWQWLFFLEALPAVLLGLVVLVLLPNRPQEARWLSDAEKAWIQSRINADAARTDLRQQHRLAEVFTSGRVWLLCLLYFLLNVGGYGYEMWLPSIIKGFSGQSDLVVGWINAIPYLIAAVVMLVASQHSDRTGERRWHVAIAAISSALGFVLSAYLKSPYLAMAALALAFAGIKSTLGPFWALGTAFLSGTAAAGGIALINSVGNLGGFFGPTMVGVIQDRTGSNLAGLLFLGGALFGMGLLALALGKPPSKHAFEELKP
ncbi:MAG: MFS transporter [Verrucomicrobiales bacterium]|nr:MFS transporter [Verrucomicrobiales bacterium]